jgi:hypothetical protein
MRKCSVSRVLLGGLRATEGDYAKAANLNRNVADKSYTTKPQRLWADLAFRNIAAGQDGELANMMGLCQVEGPPVTIDAPKRPSVGTISMRPHSYWPN